MSLARSKARKSRALEAVLVLALIACVILALRPHFQKQAEEHAEREERARVMVDKATEIATDMAYMMPAAIAVGMKYPYATPEETELELAPIQVQSLSRKLARDPDNLSFLNERAYLYDLLGETQAYLDDLERILELDPESANWVHNSRAFVWAKNGEFEKALPEARKAVELEPDANNLDILGFVLVGVGEHQEAVKTYDQAIALEETVHSLWGRAAALRCLGETPASEADFRRVRELDPDYCLHWELDNDPGWHAKKKS